MSNVKHNPVTREQYARSHAICPFFRKGYEDYTKNRPFDYNIETKRDAVHYERGRAFAIYCQTFRTPRATWRKDVLAKTAQDRLLQATSYRFVF